MPPLGFNNPVRLSNLHGPTVPQSFTGRPADRPSGLTLGRAAKPLGIGDLQAAGSLPRRNPLESLQSASEPAGSSMATDVDGNHLLREARRALAVGDTRRATNFVQQAKTPNAQYPPDKDNPQKVEAAIRDYRDLQSQPKDTAAYRHGYTRMLMQQSQALLQAGDYDLAERLANSASDWATRHQFAFGPYQPKPSDLLNRIAAERRGGGSSETPLAPAARALPLPNSPGPSLAAKQQADKLVQQARSALSAGQLDLAENLARQAEQLGIASSAYAPGEDRPGLVMFDVRQAWRRNPSGVTQTGSQSVSPATGPLPPQHTASAALYNPANDPTRTIRAGARLPKSPADPRWPNVLAQNALAPTPLPSPESAPPPPVAADPNASGPMLFQQGTAALKAHDTGRALELFRQASGRMGELDPVTQQRLQSYLQLLSAPRVSPPPMGRALSPAEEAAAQQHVLARQVSADVASREAKARAMLPSDPEASLTMLEEARRTVEQAGLEPANREQLLRRVDRQISETQRFIEQNRPRIELDQRNDRVRSEIEREQRVKLENQERLHLMVDDFNRKMDEQRFEEAEVVAKRAAELDPENPVVLQLLLRSKFVRRFVNNQRLRELKEEGFYAQLGAVDLASPGFNDYEPYRFPDIREWQDLTALRSRFRRDRGRQRTERELEIEQKLKTPVPSMQFKNEPLSSVLDYLSKLTEVNMHLDPQGLAEYGITSDTPVTIELQHDIMLKSVLNLILDPLHLSYVIKDEVLKITTEQQREGEVHTVTYSVADLIVPVPNFIASPRMGLAGALHDAMGNVGYGGGSPFGTVNTPLAVVASREGEPSAAIHPALLAQASGAGMHPGGGGMPMGFGPGGLGGGSQPDWDSLIELITSTIQPNTWDEVGGPGSIREFETNLSLVISQTQEVHEEIVDLLEQLRRMQDLQVTIEVRFITLNDNFFERIGVDFDFDIDDDIDRPFQVFGRVDPNNPGDSTTGTEPGRNTLDVDHDRSVTVGMQSPGVFSADLDIPFVQNSFGLAVPQFGGFDASAGAQLGFAILSDIEAFFFINAAQGDRRSNVLQAPKVTLFNGQQAFISDTSQSPFVISVIPIVGDFAAAQQPVIVVLSEGTLMTVQAVVSQDRRFVRLTVVPFFSKIGEVNEFQFTGSSTTTTDTTADGVIDADNADPNSRTSSSSNSTVTRNGTTVQLPTFSFVTVTTTVSVPDGGTVLLGGIKRLSEGRNEFGVPILNKIPYINRLFKNVGIGRETQSLMMMVTPRIIIQEEEEEKLGILPP